MKKVFVLMFIAITILSFCSCSSSDEGELSNVVENNTAEPVEVQENITDTVKLIDECEYVLADGISKNGDYYYLVANESKSYDGKDEIGVIKNNKWLVPLTSDHPFINKDGAIIGLESYKSEIEKYGKSDRFAFSNNCCFFAGYDFKQVGYKIIFNSETGESKHIEIDDTFDYDVFLNISIDVVSGLNQRRIIGQNDDSVIIKSVRGGFGVNDKITIKIFNTKSMSVTKEFAPNQFWMVSPISEGVFSVVEDNDSGDRFFYDVNGKKVIDLSKYNIGKFDYCYFVDGKCTFTATNDAGDSFEITIDKSGNVVEEKAL